MLMIRGVHALPEKFLFEQSGERGRMNLPIELLELSDLSQWVAYKRIWNEGKNKYDKLPINPHNGKKAKANDVATWSTYAEALKRAVENGLSGDEGGIGFMFAGGYAGIDLDDVVLDDGALKPFAEEIVRVMDSYTEYSPSGKGLHILFRLSVPLSVFGRDRRNDKLGVEMYDEGRYFTVTGRVYGDSKPIAERTQQAQKIYSEYLAIHSDKNIKKPPLHSHKGTENYDTDMFSDSELLDKMFTSQHGAEIRALFSGDKSSYNNDDSRADLALCSYLAFWTGNDTAKIDSLFRHSGLMRSKWDELHGEQTYGEMTISRSLIDSEGYHPKRNSSYVILPEQEEAEASQTKVRKAESSADSGKKQHMQLTHISSYIESAEEATALDSDIARFRKYKDRKTGYSNIDAKMSLYPGLYVLGAISSLGKTTFCGQLADQLADSGEHVLYFSLEQTTLELVSKGLSRLMFSTNKSTALTSMEIRRGSSSEALKIARAIYASQTKHEYIVECGFDTSVEDIAVTVREYIDESGIKPIVFIDYLQILAPVNNSQTSKDVVDYNVRALKKLQTENDLVVIVISSLNRQNYLTPIDFASFKESGGIEYTCDVMWGIQLAVMNDELFDKESKLKAKREAVKKAKIADPRDIELVCLKNRYGVSSYTCRFKYYARYDYFLAVSEEESPQVFEL